MAGTHTARTQQLLKKYGYTCGLVERYNFATKTRHDLFGFIDIIAMSPTATIGIQCTSDGARAEHIRKIQADPGGLVREWMACRSRGLWVLTWRKRKKADARGVRRLMWDCRLFGFRRSLDYQEFILCEDTPATPETVCR